MANEFTVQEVTVFSEGTRLAAEIFRPQIPSGREGYPAILLCHGWGGLKDHLAKFAAKFAARGYLCMTFDYRGWGESDGKIIATADTSRLLEVEERDLKVRVLREIVDPIDQTTDVRNCLAFLETEAGVNRNRIALWGTSYGAGHAVFVTGTDDRIKATVAQIGGFGFPDTYKQVARARQADKARGKIDPVVPQHALDGVSGLKGTPDIARMVEHSQLDAARKVTVPTLIMDAEFEELNNRIEHGFAAYNIIKQNAPSEYHTFPCKHYGVYEEYFERSTDMALDWYDKYL